MVTFSFAIYHHCVKSLKYVGQQDSITGLGGDLYCQRPFSYVFFPGWCSADFVINLVKSIAALMAKCIVCAF